MCIKRHYQESEKLTEWEKIFANHTFDKEFVSRMFKKKKKKTLTTQQLKDKQPNLKMSKEIQRLFLKKIYKWPKTHIKDAPHR